MVWHAIDVLDDAFEATKQLLLPFSVRKWLTLAVVAFFVSGTTGFNLNFNLGSWDVPAPGTGGAPTGGIGEVIAAGGSVQLLLALLGGVVALAVLVALLYVAAVLEFVFVEIAARQAVRLREFVGESTRRGLSLFGFRLVIGLISLAGVVFFGAMAAIGNEAVLVALVLLLPVAVLLGVGLWVLTRLTTDFVVPVMIAEDAGVVQGWRAFWPALRADWKQYGLYVVVRILLGAVAAVVAGIGFSVVGLVLGIPFAVVGIVAYTLLVSLLGVQIFGLVVVAGLTLLFVVALVAIGTTLIQVPLQTYLRYYSLFVLGAVTPRYDLVGEVRSAIEQPGDAAWATGDVAGVSGDAADEPEQRDDEIEDAADDRENNN